MNVTPAAISARARRYADAADYRWWLASREPLIQEAILSLPATFGLRAWPGVTFRVGARESYLESGRVTLYVQRLNGDGYWRDWHKGSPAEVKAQIC